ncbi:MAG: hypothetical protein ACOCXP_03015, partial [Candidatus Dojkabacteria bacterium]
MRRIDGTLYRNIIKPILFRFDPEDIHDFFTIVGKTFGSSRYSRFLIKKLWDYDEVFLNQNIHGKTFLNPVGLSAGFDKDGKLVGILPAVGFAHAEFGSVTWESYGGNEKPRLVRFPEHKSLLVNYGLKNDGTKAVVSRLSAKEQYLDEENFALGISIAKTNSQKTASDKDAIRDYDSSLSFILENLKT